MQIINHSQHVELKNLTKSIYIEKDGGVDIYYYQDDNGRHRFDCKTNKRSFRIDYERVTSPVTATANDLLNLLFIYFNIDSVISAGGTFVNGDLVAGVLTINSGLGSAIKYVLIQDPSGESQIMTFVPLGVDSATVDFGGAIAAGTWSWTVFTA